MFKKILPMAIICLSLSGCLDSDGDVGGSSTSNVLAGNVGPGTLPNNVTLGSTGQLPAPMDGSTCAAAGNILEWDGSAWQCVPPTAVSTVAANNITPGAIGAGVTLPGSQITGPIGLTNLPADLDGAGCAAAGNILEWDGAAWDCVAPSVSLTANEIGAGTFGTGVILPAAQLGAGALPTNVTISLASLPADLNGATCADDNILVWDAATTAWGCEAPGSGAASSIVVDADPAGNLTPATVGDIAYDSTDNELQMFDGTNWVAVDDDQGAESVLTDADPANNLSSAVAGDIAYDTTDNELQVFDGTSWGPVAGGTSVCDADDDTCIYMEKAADEDYVRIDTDGVERVIVKPTGEVGIGIADPDHTLDVADSIQIDSTGPFAILNSGADDLLLQINGGDSTQSERPSINLWNSTSGNANEGILQLHARKVNDGDIELNTEGGDIIFKSNTLGSPLVLHAEGSTGNIGINTASPSVGDQTLKLDIEGPVGATHYCDEDGNNCFTATDIGGTSVCDADDDTCVHMEQAVDEDYVRIETDGTERVTVEPTGDVGIGITNPIASLDIRSQKLQTALFSNDAPADPFGTRIALTHAGNSNGFLVATGGLANWVDKFRLLPSSGTYSHSGTGTPLGLTMDNSGNIGINEFNPSTGEQALKLDVEGALGATHYCDEDGNNCFAATDIGGTSVCDADDDTCIYMEKAADEDYVRINTDGVERVTVTPTGNVGIGLTSPTDLLHIQSLDSTQRVGRNIGNDAGSLLFDGIFGSAHPNTAFAGKTVETTNSPAVINNRAGGTSHSFIRSGTLSNTDLILDGTGNVGINTASPSVGDQTLKLDVEGPVGATHYCDEDGNNCVPGNSLGSASSIQMAASDPAGAAAGDVYYNTGDNVSYVFNGTDWEPLAASGGSDNIVSDPDPATNVTGNVAGDIIYDSTDNELQVWNGTAWIAAGAAGGDNMGDHIATQNINMDGNSIVGAVSTCDADSDTCVYMEKATDEDNLRFDTDGAQRMLINQLGKIAINTISTNQGQVEIASNASDPAGFVPNLVFQDISPGVSNGRAAISAYGSGMGLWGNSAQAVAGNPPMLYLEDNQQIGIKTTTPNKMLSVAVAAGNDGVMTSRATSTNSVGILANANGPFVGYSTSTADLTTLDAYIQLMEPTAALNLGPDQIKFQNLTGGGFHFLGGNLGIGSTNPDAKLMVNNGATIGRYEATGWTHSSDRRLKKNIHSLDGSASLEKILQLNPVEYVFKNDLQSKKQIGFIAQDVEPLFPEAITTDKQSLMSMAYANILAPLVKAFQQVYSYVVELDKRATLQESKFKELQAENVKLKKRLEKLENIILKTTK